MANNSQNSIGAPLLDNYGLTTPDDLAAARQAQSDQQFMQAAIANRPMLGLGMDLGRRLSTHLGGDSQAAAAKQNQDVLSQIREAAGGDPIKALQMAAQMGIPGAMQTLQAMQEHQAKVAKEQADTNNAQSQADNRPVDNARADAAAAQQTKKDTWETVREKDGYIIQKNGLGEYKALKAADSNAEISAMSTPEDKQAFIDSIASYDQPMPTASARGLKALGMSLAELTARVKAKNPQWSSVGVAGMQFFTKGPGGDQLQAQGAASQHLDQYLEAMKAYKANDLRPLSNLATTLGLQTGASGPSTLNTIAGVLGPEIAKAIIKAGGGVAERTAKEKTLTAELADPQKLGNVAAYKGLMYGQRLALRDRFLSSAYGLKPEDFDMRFPMPSALASVAATHSGGPAVNSDLAAAAAAELARRKAGK